MGCDRIAYRRRGGSPPGLLVLSAPDRETNKTMTRNRQGLDMTNDNLRRIREALGYSQREMGEACGYSGKHVRGTIHRYETGAREMPPRLILELMRLAEKHDIEFE